MLEETDVVLSGYANKIFQGWNVDAITEYNDHSRQQDLMKQGKKLKKNHIYKANHVVMMMFQKLLVCCNVLAPCMS